MQTEAPSTSTIAEAHIRENIERPYTIAEVAALTGYSRKTVTRLFAEERGVLVINRPTENRKRRYRSIRIPRPVYDRVIREIAVR